MLAHHSHSRPDHEVSNILEGASPKLKIDAMVVLPFPIVASRASVQEVNMSWRAMRLPCEQAQSRTVLEQDEIK